MISDRSISVLSCSDHLTHRLLDALTATEAFLADSATLPVAMPSKTFGPTLVIPPKAPGFNSGLVYHRTADGETAFALPL